MQLKDVNDNVLYTKDCESIKELAEKATKDTTSLKWANLLRANLQETDLRRADLREADLRRANLQEADLRKADLRGANLQNTLLQGADLRGADLRGANLQEANLQEADLRGANIDDTCWPLWCGSLGVKIDKRQFCQFLYHVYRAGESVDDPQVRQLLKMKTTQKLISQFHRFDECEKMRK